MSTSDADLIIAGAGCAGLSALHHLMEHGLERRRVLLVDRDLEPRDDRTWSFWGSPDSPFASLADRHWHRVEVGFPGRRLVQELEAHGARSSYTRVRSIDYATAILSAAEAHPAVELVQADIEALEPGRPARVSTSAGDLHAPQVWQSVRLSPADAVATVRHPLRQHFGGWEVQTQQAIFDPDIVTLMDFDTPQHGATAFFYVLPVAPDRALVEHTMFSPIEWPADRHDDQIRRHLDRLGAGDVTVERAEHGSIPMEDRAISQRWGEGIWNLGTVGGMTKPTTGYTFQRIHDQTRHLARTWLRHGAPEPLPDAPGRYDIADRTLLHLLHRRPELGRPIFERLFTTTPIDQVFRFLDEDSRLGEDLRMMGRLPWVPFLRAGTAEVMAGRRRRTR